VGYYSATRVNATILLAIERGRQGALTSKENAMTPTARPLRRRSSCPPSSPSSDTIAALALAGSLAAVAPAAQAQRLDPPAAPYNCSQWGFNGEIAFDQTMVGMWFQLDRPQAMGR